MTLLLHFHSTGRNALRSRPLPQLRLFKPFRPFRRHSSTTPARTSKSTSSTTAASGAGTSIPVPNTIANLPLWQRLGPLSRFFEAYGRSQRKRPYTTQFASSLFIYFLGDMSAQSISGEEYDYKRTLRSLCIGGISSIPSYKW